ncbi:High osmolarity signaling protein SHO1 [Lachnellula suecica]|uniref:High osmolarity signaling protein SHO1 n=1 Tax=Lachnellula suecica TaxID=602035 RepID=A0A8T9BV51_9HELO|nr:High osmolarity signaling protein SHO1 [Lachnellula suecica]
MSFGFGVGDFLAVGRLVLDLYNACKDAPGEFQEIGRELSSIHTVLSGLATQASDPSSLLLSQGKERLPEWTSIQENLEFTLGELQDLVKRYYKMGRNAWLRIQFVGENLKGLRARLAFHLGVVNTFVGSLSLSALGRMEPALGRIEMMLRERVREERKGNREPTVLSAYENDDAVSWEKIEMDLALEGVSAQEFEKNRERIRELLAWVVDHGKDLEALEEVGVGDSVSQTGTVRSKEVVRQSAVVGIGQLKKPTAEQLEIIEIWNKKAKPRRGSRGMPAPAPDPKKNGKQESGLWKMTTRFFSGSKAGERKYTYRAKAIENYESQRPNELSYMKDEILEVAPSSGGWWPARNKDGKKGIVSSDSLVLDSEIDDEPTPPPATTLRNDETIRDYNGVEVYPFFYYGETCAKAWAKEKYEPPLWCTNDLAFQKHEVLELSTYNGLWLLGRNRNGETGIVPSDHLAVLWTKFGKEDRLSLSGKNEMGKDVSEAVSIEALRKNENGVFEKYLSPEAILKNWG